MHINYKYNNTKQCYTYIGSDVFSGCNPNLVIYGPSGSYAETYATKHGIGFVDYLSYAFVVNFNSNGGTAVASQNANYNTTISTPTDPTRTGYTFDGWYTAAAGGTQVTFPYSVTTNTTLYAHWTANFVTSYLLGDANSNGIVSLKDATAIQKYLAGLITFNSTQKVAADVDNSGSINLKDVTVIQKYLAKMIMSLSK